MLKKIGAMCVILSIFFIGIVSLSVHANDFLELVKDASPEEVQEAIDAGVDINARSEKGVTALIEASSNNTLEVIEILIENGANVNARTEKGETALMKASNTNTLEVVEILIENGANVNARSELQITPLMEAAASNEDPEVINLLLDNGADGSVKSSFGSTAFEYSKHNEEIKGTETYWRLNDAQYE